MAPPCPSHPTLLSDTAVSRVGRPHTVARARARGRAEGRAQPPRPESPIRIAGWLGGLECRQGDQVSRPTRGRGPAGDPSAAQNQSAPTAVPMCPRLPYGRFSQAQFVWEQGERYFIYTNSRIMQR